MKTIALKPQTLPQTDENSLKISTLPPLSLYIHFPWCVQKCPYCDFNSHQIQQWTAESEQVYIAALVADLEAALPQVWQRTVNTIFVGGGTPSLLSPQALDTLLMAVRARLPVLPDAEITLEANPGTTDQVHFAAYRSCGINRLSLGVQSFNDAYLASLQRIHDGDTALKAIEQAGRVFDRVNIDLMYALPEQTVIDAKKDIEVALATGVTHLSCYQLTLEPNTPFCHNPPTVPSHDDAAIMQELIEATLTEHDFIHYETAAFAREGQQCQHNLNYWMFGDYLGIGAGAHSKLTLEDSIVRQVRCKHPSAYLKAAQNNLFLQSEIQVPQDDRVFEFMMNALRLHQGFPLTLLQQRTGVSLLKVIEDIRLAQEKGFLEIRGDNFLLPTLKGRYFLNDLLLLFLRD